MVQAAELSQSLEQKKSVQTHECSQEIPSFEERNTSC